MLKTTRAILAALTLSMFVTSATAQPWPDGPVRFVVPYAPGGAIDLITRVIGDKLGMVLKVPVVVENKPGASTIIATTAVRESKADGSVFLITDTTHGANPALRKNLPYNTLSDFSSVILLAELPAVLIVPSALPVSNLQDLVSLAKKEPGKLNYSSAGFGTMNHLGAELFKKEFGLDIVQVPYQGGAPAMQALIAGDVQMLFIALPPALPSIAGGRVKAIAVTSPQRVASLPNVPTVAEIGFPSFAFAGSIGVRAPGATSPTIVKALNVAINQVLEMPDVRDQLARAGAVVVGGPPERFTTYLESEIGKWNKTITPEMRAD